MSQYDQIHKFLVKRGDKGVIHRAVREGGGGMEIMMTTCGLSIRWDQPHSPWLRAPWYRGAKDAVTCKKCKP
jgi:hypothetical protein